jgi:hypothetical protein
MSVARVVEAPESPVSEERERGEKRYTRTFRVVTTRPNEEGDAIRADARLPKIGSRFRQAVCIRVTTSRTEAATVQIVTAEYSTKVEPGAGIGSVDQIFAAPSIQTWSVIRGQMTTAVDAKGKPYVNTLGDPFDPPPPKDVTRLHLSLRKNKHYYYPREMLAYADKVNTDPWLGFQPGEAKCAGIPATEVWENNLHYWIVNYEFDFLLLKKLPDSELKAGFQPIQLLNAGGRYYDEDADKIKVADDDHETAYNGLMRLAADSTKVTQKGRSHWLMFYPYETLPFGPLALP